MDVLIIVSTDAATDHFSPLAQALNRCGASWGAFFTNNGVNVLTDASVAASLEQASQAFACHESWRRQLGEAPCPIPFGSQMNNSAMVGEAGRIVSL